jgi:hypothetical protein
VNIIETNQFLFLQGHVGVYNGSKDMARFGTGDLDGGTDRLLIKQTNGMGL